VGLRNDLEGEVGAIFRSPWTEREGTVVPTEDSVKLTNDAVKLDATVLYADMADSTTMVDHGGRFSTTESYKSFLHCAAKIIRSEGGTITAYDGDRIMAVYLGGSKNTLAARTAMKIKWASINIINPAKQRQYPTNNYPIRHAIGIDTSSVFVANAGVRGAKDLVWVGRAANYAAKLSALPDGYAYITEEVYNDIHETVRSHNGQRMWEERVWVAFGSKKIYRSSWHWSLD
jgi:class 3 adenylate cyclase